ncbi:MAG: hypothetical protein OEL78_04390 [Hyphomicrobiales bacterium]|nr:hypothetical protein [Hyphomicrobiales bacterium]
MIGVGTLPIEVPPARVAELLMAAPDLKGHFWRWFEDAWRAAYLSAPGDSLLAAGLEAWARVIGSEKALRWWKNPAGGKPALPPAALLRGLAGGAYVAPAEQGWFTPAAPGRPDGLRAITWTAMDAGAGLDIVAMDPADPGRWWRRSCCADILPGRMTLDFLESGQDIRLFETPLAWLAAGCPPGGFCVLDWQSRTGQELLADIDAARYTVICDSDAHAKRLRALARPKRPALRLRVALDEGAE